MSEQLESAIKAVAQWENHDRFRVTEAEKSLWSNGTEPDDVAIARELIRLIAQIDGLKQRVREIECVDSNNMSKQLASDWDHRIIDSVSIALDGKIGLSTDHKRLREQIENGPSADKLKVAVEIAVAFMRYAQDLKAERGES